MVALEKEIRLKVIEYCNKELVPDENFNPEEQYHSDWFYKYFDFLDDEKLKQQLGDAYYQARFVYKLMAALKLPKAKHMGIVKFQIIQYVSICEALLDTVIEKFGKDDATFGKKIEFTPITANLPKNLKFNFEKAEVELCSKKITNVPLKLIRIDDKTSFAASHNLITQEQKKKLDNFYKQRNNVHLLKAYQDDYKPTIQEAKETYEFMKEFTTQIKTVWQQDCIDVKTNEK